MHQEPSVPTDPQKVKIVCKLAISTPKNYRILIITLFLQVFMTIRASWAQLN